MDAREKMDDLILKIAPIGEKIHGYKIETIRLILQEYASPLKQSIKELEDEVEKLKDYGRDRELFVTTKSIENLRDKINTFAEEDAGTLRDERRTYINGYKEGYYKCLNTQILPSQNSITTLESQLKEAGSKAVRFAAWLSINNYKSSNGVMYALYEGDTLIHVKSISELFEIFEQENK